MISWHLQSGYSVDSTMGIMLCNSAPREKPTMPPKQDPAPHDYCSLETVIKIDLTPDYARAVVVHTSSRICDITAGSQEQIVDNALAGFASCNSS